jgi:hypothetical protein
MRQSSSFPALVFIIILGIGAGLAFVMYRVTGNIESAWIGAIAFVIALVVCLSIQVADQWDKAVILRFTHLRGRDCFLLSRSLMQFLTGLTLASSRLVSRQKKPLPRIRCQ